MSSVTREGEDLVLTLSARDHFQGEVVAKEKDMLTARVAQQVRGITRVRLAYREVKSEPVQVDQRVELLRKVFRGEVVKGEGHGDQSV